MTVAVDELPASYAAVHRYDGAVLQHDAREQIVPMAIQPRDFAIVLDVWRYKFLTAPMVHELHWDGGSLWPAQRRLQKMFNAGLLERFRPVSLCGSYPWTYHLGDRGHVILRDSQVVDTGWRYRPHVVHEFGHVLHDLQLNAWVLAYQRQPGVRFLSWEGERTIEPPPTTRDEREEPRWLPGGGWTVRGLRDFRHRPVRPDAVIELDRGGWEVLHTLLIEFDRTRRVVPPRGEGRSALAWRARARTGTARAAECGSCDRPCRGVREARRTQRAPLRRQRAPIGPARELRTRASRYALSARSTAAALPSPCVPTAERVFSTSSASSSTLTVRRSDAIEASVPSVVEDARPEHHRRRSRGDRGCTPRPCRAPSLHASPVRRMG